MRIVVAGAAGQLGQAVVARFSGAHEVVPLARRDLDLSRHEDVMRVVGGAPADVVINCAAYNAVDQAEDDVSAALEGNAFAVRSLARAADAAGAVLVHYSTDFVFDGERDRPYTEDDEPRPQSVYGQSKLLGEWFALDAGGFALRVESLFGGPKPRSSVDRIIEALVAGRDARVFVDRIVSPSYVDDVAWATAVLLERRAGRGVYHCVNTGHATWHELGVEIARLLGQPPRLTPVRVADVQLRARRPQYCALSNEKLARAGAPMPTWQDALRRYVERRTENGERGP
jgi:dTDP-4-dehydrorhamnose reductase